MTKPAYKQHISDLAGILKKNKIRYVVISPGSRNAPIIQVLQGDKQFLCYSIIDERSAGYVALGMAKQSNEAVVIVTTSGTATLNLAPAVAEAYYQNIPLIILTADRPDEWPPQFGNQKINQENIFVNVKNFYSLSPEISSEMELKQVNRNVARLIRNAMQGIKGPVHLNITLKEPLYEKISSSSSIQESDYSEDKVAEAESGNYEADGSKLFHSLSNQEKVLFIAGMNKYSAEDRDILQSLSMSFQLSIIGENITNLPPELVISVPEILLGSLNDKSLEEIKPDLVVLFGGQVVSKKTRLYIETLQDLCIVIPDSFPGQLFKKFMKKEALHKHLTNAYHSIWKKYEAASLKLAEQFIKEAGFSNLTACSTILDAIPASSIVHLGNSGTIRYSQLKRTRDDLEYYGNRGTSGIDGCLSTAVGAALVSKKLHVSILGDLSFVYDSNAMWNGRFPDNLRVIVLNDKGGGIFRLLDGPDRMPFFEEFSLTSHPVSLQHLAEAYGLTYSYANNYAQLNKELENIFTRDSGPLLLEVDTSKSENSSIFKQYYKSIHYQ